MMRPAIGIMMRPEIPPDKRFCPSFQIAEGEQLKAAFIVERLWTLAGLSCSIEIWQRSDQVAVVDLHAGGTLYIQANSLDLAYKALVGFHFDLLWRDSDTKRIIKSWRPILDRGFTDSDGDGN